MIHQQTEEQDDKMAAAASPIRVAAISTVAAPPPSPQSAIMKIIEPWLPLVYMAMITLAELVFIECYCHWHGAQFLLPNPFALYSADNIHRLAQIGFVGGTPPSVMGFTAEILMWASLGVWSQRISGMAGRYREQKPDPPYDLAVYIGILGCHTSIAAAVMIVLKLSGFKVFNLSLDSFDATVGLAFILGYFGNHTDRLLNRMREQVFGKKGQKRTSEN